MQIRLPTSYTSEQYLSQKAWRRASLPPCPWHPEGGCGFKKHGSYGRKLPVGVRVPRCYCPIEGKTLSLLPDFLAARLPGTLSELEQVATVLEQSSTILEAADTLRPDILLPGGLRWLRRRRLLLADSWAAIRSLLPDTFGDCECSLTAFRARLSQDSVLEALRQMAEPMLSTLPPPLGFGQPAMRQQWLGARAPPHQG